MEQKNRLVIVIAIVALIVAAMLASFGRVIFAANTPDVILPSSSGNPLGPSDPNSQEHSYQREGVSRRLPLHSGPGMDGWRLVPYPADAALRSSSS